MPKHEPLSIPYQPRVDAAKQWLGGRYLLAEPVPKRKQAPRHVPTAAGCLIIALSLTGCAASRLDKEATAQDRAACQQAVSGYGGAEWMIAYRDCLLAKGYK